MKIAFIGAGWVANRHLNQLAKVKDLEVVGHVSPIAQELQTATNRWGGRGYKSVDDLLSNEKVDAAWITVPPAEHGGIELALIEKGIPIFVEKPLSADRATGEEIGQKIREKGVIAAVGYHWRAMDTIPEVKEFLIQNPARMVLAAWHDSTPPPAWWQKQGTSGGQMVEQATHLFDLARYLVGEAKVIDALGVKNKRLLYPDSDVADVSAALINFTNGIPGVFSATCVLGGGVDIYVKIICEGVMITITQTDVSFDYFTKKSVIPIQKDPFLLEDLAFIDAIKTNQPDRLFSDYQDALKTHALCHDVLEKYQQKQRNK
jgi:myo-inositol 2-dehydrogenase/D-chiro-inositol 1-dehydrogenase